MRTCTRIAIALAATAGGGCHPVGQGLVGHHRPVDDAQGSASPGLEPDEGLHAVGARRRRHTRARTGHDALHTGMGTRPREHLVTGHDTYDFTKVDALLDAIASRGHQAVIRFTLDTPGEKTGMPQYLIDAGTDTSRYPTAATKTHGMGYYDDSLGYATLEGTSWHFIPKLKKQGEGDAWQHSPIGGELTRAKVASAAMGYTLQATRTSVTYNQVKATVVVEIKNTGVAPFYATWPLEVVLVDERRVRSWPARASSPSCPRSSRARRGG